MCYDFIYIVPQIPDIAVNTRRPRPSRLRDALTIAQQSGLLRGAKSKVIRGRMPEALVQKAKAASGARSDTELIEMALANLAVADQYPDWLLSQRGTVPEEIDFEF